MSIGTPAPAVRHWYFGGQRGGGFFAFFETSTGAPGTTLVVPASNEAHGSTQRPDSFGLPFASLSFKQRCPRPQVEFCLHERPRPAVRGSRETFLAGRASADASRNRAANRACIQMRIGMMTAV